MTMISIGMAGLGTAQAGLQTTSHNIANAHTPGYSRQSTLQATNIPQFTGTGYLGQGAHAVTTARAYDNFLDLQAREAQTAASYYELLSAQLGNVDQMFSDPSAGLSPALDGFFAAVGSVAANPADTAARVGLVEGGEVLAARVRDLHARLEALRGGLNAQVESSVASINALAAGVAEINREVVRAYAGGHAPNDLLDRRDTMLRDMAKELRISTTTLATGAISVSLSNGQPVVLDTTAFAIAVGADPLDAANLAVGIRAGSTFQPFNDSLLSGGALGAVAAFRRQTLEAAQNALGRVAGALGSALNAQHAAGFDRTGAIGAEMFSFAGARVQAGDANTGGATLAAAVTDYGALTTSDYQVDYDGASYVVRRLADGYARTYAALPQTVDGFSLSLSSGAPAAGDSFKVMPTRDTGARFAALVSDPQRIAAALPVRAAIATGNTGNGALRVETVTPPAGVNLTQPVTITFTSANTFDVSGTGTGNPVGLTYTPGMSLSYNGWSARLQGVMAAGDAFAVGPNLNGVGDNGNVLALAALATTRLVEGGTLSAGEGYAQAVSLVGNQAHSASVRRSAQDAILTEAEAAQQNVSGVNLDEEAANLLKYQQAYQAAGRIIATANALFDEILGLSR